MSPSAKKSTKKTTMGLIKSLFDGSRADDGGIVCLSDFMTRGDRASGALQQLLVKQTQDVRQPINAVYYRNTALASRITCFLDYLSSELSTMA